MTTPVPPRAVRVHHRRRPLPPLRVFILHSVRNAAVGGVIIAGSLAIGTFGYRLVGARSWVDAVYNAAMLLTGEGPAPDAPSTHPAKLFATAYALFAGVAFLTAVGVLFAPALHRFLHRFHLEFTFEEEAVAGAGAADGADG